jgi:ABC-2 type transport system permease protein
MNGVTGTLTLLRFHLRRDRWTLLAWIAGIFLLYYATVGSLDGLYPTQADLDKAAAGMGKNTAFIAMLGPTRAIDTYGGQLVWQAHVFGIVVAALMSMFLVGRHTRAEEESGRDELVRAAAVGRGAPLLSTALVVLIANVVLGVAVWVGLWAYGLAFAGSVSVGLSLALSGLVFGAVAMVAVQLTEAVRGAYGITGAVIVAAYVLRAAGDVGNGALSWASPIGWAQSMHSFSGDRWWPALLLVGAVAVLGVVAVQLYSRRDIGAGVWATRPGPARAGAGLSSVLGLAWRLQRGSVIGWTVGMFVAGFSYGTIGDDVGDVIGDSSYANDVFGAGGGSITDTFYASAAGMLALICTGFAISSVLRLRGEEADGLAELLLATAQRRVVWALSHLVVTVFGVVTVVLGAGLGMGLGYALVTGDFGAIGRLLAATAIYIGPVLVLASVSWLVYAARPLWAAFGWLTLAYCFVVLFFATVFRMPQWAQNVSPFHHMPLMPAADFRAAPVLVVLAVALALGAAGLVAVRRRDLAAL